MKFVFAILALVVLSHQAEEHTLAEHVKECKTISGVSDESSRKFIHGEPVVDLKLDAYILCVSKKEGSLSEENEIDYDKVKSRVTEDGKHSEEKVEAAIKKCKDVEGDIVEEKTIKFFKCFVPEINTKKN